MLISVLSRVDDRLRRAGRREEALPQRQIEMRIVDRLGDRRHVGRAAGALGRRDREDFHLAALQQRRRRGKAREIHIDVAAEQIVERGPRALVGHVGEIGLGAKLEEFAGEMARRAGAGRGEGQRLFLGSALASSAIVEYGALAGTTSASGTTEASATGTRSFSAL